MATTVPVSSPSSPTVSAPLPEPMIRLDVGGHRFTVSREILMREPNSRLAHLMDPEFYVEPRDQRVGLIFLDYDPATFIQVLDYLETGKLLRDSKVSLEAIHCMAETLGLDKLKKIVEKEKQSK